MPTKSCQPITKRCSFQYLLRTCELTSASALKTDFAAVARAAEHDDVATCRHSYRPASADRQLDEIERVAAEAIGGTRDEQIAIRWHIRDHRRRRHVKQPEDE